jgi:hypothetical protein
MTDAHRIALGGAFRLLIQKVEHSCRARLDLEQAQHDGQAVWYPSEIKRKERALEHAEFVLDASIEQFIDVLEQTFSPEASRT